MNNVAHAGDSVATGTRNFADQVVTYAEIWGPRILAALIILLIGWLVARAVKWAIASLLNKSPLGRRANHPNLHDRHPSTVGAQVGNAAYWVILLVAVFLAAQPLGLASATGPLGDMLRGFSNAVPRIIGATLIFFLGYVSAGVAKKATEAVVTASHVERFSSKVGTQVPSDATMLPRTLGSIVFALIIIPVAIASLDTLNIAAISQPATAMLRIILNAIPHVIAAGIILALAYVVGKFASRLLTRFLETAGFDKIIGAVGLFPQGSGSQTTRVNPSSGREEVVVSPSSGTQVTPSKAVGSAAMIAIVIFGLMEAFRQLNFVYGSRILAEILALFGQVLFGALIIGAAVLIARMVAQTISASGGDGAKLGATIVRVAIIVLGVAIGLRFMGLADDIITLAFGLILGALAVGFAIALGLGGREPMQQLLQQLLGKAEASAAKPSSPPQPTGSQPPA